MRHENILMSHYKCKNILEKKMSHLTNFKCGVRHGIPIALGYFAVSFTFGIAAAKCGMSMVQSGVLSLLNVTSAGQFAGLEVISAGGAYLELIMTQIIINLRYCLMSFALSQKLDRKTGNVKRMLVAFGITDEIFGISASRPGPLDPFYNYGAMAVAIPGWTIGTMAGTFLGSIMPKYILTSLSLAIYGMFIAIIIPPAKKDRNVLISIMIAMCVSSFFEYFPRIQKITGGFISEIAGAAGKVTGGFVIIIATIAAAGIMALIRPIEETGDKDEQ